MASPSALCPIVSTASRVPTRGRGVSRCPLVSTFGCAPGRLRTASPRKSATGRVSRVAVPRAVSDERAPRSDFYDAAAHPNNVYHEPVSGTPPPAQSHAFASNPGQPGHLPEMGATRQRLVDREAAAVQTRDYATASAAAGLLARLVQIEHELMHHDTAEMEASLAQDYQDGGIGQTAEGSAPRRVRNHQSRSRGRRLRRSEREFESRWQGRRPTRGRGRRHRRWCRRGRARVRGVPRPFQLQRATPIWESVVVRRRSGAGGMGREEGVPMEYQMDSKTWSATVMMPQASRFKFKFVVVGGLSPRGGGGGGGARALLARGRR